LGKKNAKFKIVENTVYLVGGFNPFEKYARQIGNLLQIGVHIKKVFETTTYPP